MHIHRANLDRPGCRSVAGRGRRNKVGVEQRTVRLSRHVTVFRVDAAAHHQHPQPRWLCRQRKGHLHLGLIARAVRPTLAQPQPPPVPPSAAGWELSSAHAGQLRASQSLLLLDRGEDELLQDAVPGDLPCQRERGGRRKKFVGASRNDA